MPRSTIHERWVYGVDPYYIIETSYAVSEELEFLNFLYYHKEPIHTCEEPIDYYKKRFVNVISTCPITLDDYMRIEEYVTKNDLL